MGNARAVADLAAWANAWASKAPPARRAVLLVGPPGSGKTSAAIALASERGWTLVEMNASEARNQGAIERVAGRASITHPLDAPARPSGGVARSLVLLDEADCLSGGRTREGAKTTREPVPLRAFLEGRYGTVEALNAAWGLVADGKPRRFDSWDQLPKTPGNAGWAKLPPARRDLDDWREAGRVEETGDRGGIGAIARLVRSTLQPLILTANDERALTRGSPVFRSAVRTIRFGPVEPEALAARLRTVARDEGIALVDGVLETIVRRSAGDLRAALNDLEAIAPLPVGPLQLDLLGPRDLPSDFASLTEDVLSHPRYYRSVEIRDRLDAPPDDLLPWVDENVPWFAVDAVHRDAGVRVVAVADLMLSRARRWRAYGLWSYATELLTGGASLAVRERAALSAEHAAFPAFLGEMGHSRVARGVRDSVVRKVGARLHVSRAKSRALALPFLESAFAPPRGKAPSAASEELARRLVVELDLSPEEVASLVGAPPESDEVRRLLPSEPGTESEPESEAVDAVAENRTPRGRSTVQRNLGEWGRG